MNTLTPDSCLLTSDPARVLIRVRVQPRASRNALQVESDGRIRVALTAPPVEGDANRALIVFLAKKFGIPKGGVALVRGHKSREKVVALTGITEEEARRRLSAQ